MARCFSATLVVAHAFTLSQAALEVEADQRVVSQQRKDLQFLLAREATLLGDNSLAVVTSLLQGDPKDQIPKLAEDNAPSMIVLGTHGGNRMERGLIGSGAERILRSTSCPFLTVGPRVPSAFDWAVPVERILYVTDFTPAVVHAAVYALSLAKACGAQIDVLNVVPRHAIEHPDRFLDLKTRFYAALDKLVSQPARELFDPRTFVEVENAHDQILRHIRERSIDLLLLAIRKTSYLGLEIRTSGAFQLIVDAPCPVMTITESAR